MEYVKISADFNKEGKMALIWAGKADFLHASNLGEGLENRDVSILGQQVTKLFLKPATDVSLGGIKVGTGLKVDATGLLSLNTINADTIQESVSRIFMKPDERLKLQGVEANANKYVHPATHSASIIDETADKLFLSPSERSKLQGIQDGATKYVHPATHSADMIVETNNRIWFTSEERQKLASVNTDGSVSEYVHPATHPATMIEETQDRHFITDAQQAKLASMLSGEGRFSSYTQRDTVVGEKLSTKVTSEVICRVVTAEEVPSDNNQYTIFRTSKKPVISGSEVFYAPNGTKINKSAYTADYANGVFVLYTAGAAGVYKMDYNSSPNGKYNLTNGNVVPTSQKFYKDGVEIDINNITFDPITGVMDTKTTMGFGYYTASYNYTADGKMKIKRLPLVSGTAKLLFDGVEVAGSKFTVDEVTGEVKLTSTLGAGEYSVNYDHTQGSIVIHNANIEGDYRVSVTPSTPTNGQLGEFWVEGKTPNEFRVLNTGSDATIKFDWIVLKQ